jgi:hypothetical protein
MNNDKVFYMPGKHFFPKKLPGMAVKIISRISSIETPGTFSGQSDFHLGMANQVIFQAFRDDFVLSQDSDSLASNFSDLVGYKGIVGTG